MATLKRALGRWDLTAIGVNQVIGGAIFLVPSQVARPDRRVESDRFRPDGLATLAVALCFAEVGSRFDRTGGPYVYTRAAFGRSSRSKWAGCNGSRAPPARRA
jgi:amino acid transporter